MMLWDQILVVNLISKQEIQVSMEIINGTDSSNRIKDILNIAIIIKTKMGMSMLNIAIREMRRISLMIFSIKKTKGMNPWNSSKKIIKSTASTIQTSKKVNKKEIKMPGNNTCANSKKSSKNITKNKNECMIKWMARITHLHLTMIIRSMLLAVFLDSL